VYQLLRFSINISPIEEGGRDTGRRVNDVVICKENPKCPKTVTDESEESFANVCKSEEK
jgi:hypothetical protein